MTKLKKSAAGVLAVLGAACFAVSAASYGFRSTSAESIPSVNKYEGALDTHTEDYFDHSVVQKLPETVTSEEEISVIVTMDAETVYDAYSYSDSKKTLSEYVTGNEARGVSKAVKAKSEALKSVLNRAGVDYTAGEEYDTILSGFEITIKAKDFDKVNSLLSSDATLIVGEKYNPCETQVITNEVDVYETGIFDSSSSAYQGDGVVVAVLDTGLDYTHSAFDASRFSTTDERFTLASVSAKVGETVAAGFTPNLTGEDVYVSKKVPYAYDYADKDADVFPIDSEHGTHVAGIIAGKDDTITGVAPNAQLAIMKVFSDTQQGAKTSWILSALEDCVILGVDVINMSLGTSCGFTREVDKQNINVIYDRIHEAGISLITAASNDGIAPSGSEKNGSLALTSNPDFGTVGSPSTYEGALSVASVDGVKTSYLVYNDDIIYFNEATNSAAKKKNFVDDILKTVGEGVTEHEFEYVTIPGIGRASDYPMDKEYYKGKIVLVKRGTNTFEDKIRVALKVKGAAGIIVYNNVSGTISMSVGEDMGAACSISQDEGEKLAAAQTGKLKIRKDQVAGPFMSDFSSWGPTSDLRIKPEITAHGGEILSSVPGQKYDRLSGTSMAAPNQAGAAALIRQYVIKSGKFGTLSTVDVTARVNQLMMSTADIVYNKNGLPYAVRKQGAGLINITKAATTASYITTYDAKGNAMDKSKLELGDDKNKTGVYEMTFDINNITGSQVSYEVGSLLITEGVSKTYTSHGDTTVTLDGRKLNPETTVTGVTGGANSGNTVTVNANSTAKVTVKIVLNDEDKKYMDDSFAHGMYVEGFVTMKATNGTTVDISVPLLAFYGDWTEAPIFDEEYYDTHKDEINAGLDPEDKLMPDAYATRVVGGLYDDYIGILGAYYFIQDPTATQVAANKDHISISNQQDGNASTINSIQSIWAGLLRNVKELNMTITEDATGKVIFERTENNQLKSRSSGSNVYQSSVDVEFSALEHNLKNNTKYTVTVKAYIDYGEKADQKNVRNTFTFPLYIDFEAPVVTDVAYRTEYDAVSKKTHLFADVSIYDNHYSMGVNFGQIVLNEEAKLDLKTFDKYITPVFSDYNSTSVVTIELTDYVARLKNSVAVKDGMLVDKSNTFMAVCYDYAMNAAMYELKIPDEVVDMYFAEDTIVLNPNETKEITDILSLYPSESWVQSLEFVSHNPAVADIVNQTIIAKSSGTAVIDAKGKDANGNEIVKSLNIKVLSEGEEGYFGGYSIPEVNNFTLTGYTTNKAYYFMANSDREIGTTGSTNNFSKDFTLSMFPSESVTLTHILDSYFPDKTGVVYSVGDSRIATVSDDGTIVAQAEGNTIVMVNVTYEGRQTLYSGMVNVTVKDPFETLSIYLVSYKGLGGVVEIPDDRGITTIQQYAFSNYEYVPKDLENGDVINEEDPYHTKPTYIGEDTITKVIIPEGVTTIEQYAFANLTALEEVVLPSTLNKIGLGAFLGCKKLTKINLGNVQFINKEAFKDCNLSEIDVHSVVAIGDYSFENCKLNHVVLPASSQSLGIGAFYNNAYLTGVEFRAPKIKIGSYAFANCIVLTSVNINASVISSYAFNGCRALSDVTLGADVSVIGENAFAGTNVSAFKLSIKNNLLSLGEGGALVYKGTELVTAAPLYSGAASVVTINSEVISSGAFTGNLKISKVIAPNAIEVGANAFSGCTNLATVEMPKLEKIGDRAFFRSGLTATPDLAKVKDIGARAFEGTKVTSVRIADETKVGDYAFAGCENLATVVIGNDVELGEGAFYCRVYDMSFDGTNSAVINRYYRRYEYTAGTGADAKTYNYYRYDVTAGSFSQLTSLTIGSGAKIGMGAFNGNARLTSVTLGNGATIGGYAFYDCASLTDIDLSAALSIGEGAFAGNRVLDLCLEDSRYSPAFIYAYVDGELIRVDYAYTSSSPKLATVNLSALTDSEGNAALGTGAFAYNDKLASLTFGTGIKQISSFAFQGSKALTSVTLPETVKVIGDGAFYGSAFTALNLSNVEEIGANAFASNIYLTSVALADGAVLGDGAFCECFNLSTANNLGKVASVGAEAFASTSLTKADLSNVTKVGDFAFSDTKVEEVVFGDKLVSLGENPFFGCKIKTFGKLTEIKFNNVTIGTELTEDYEVSEKVKVIGGVLYQVVPNGGLELVSYPSLKSDVDFAVADGTVRISARALYGTQVKTVTLPHTLKSIGDKAFYDCKNLAIVVFKSYDAPILEEEYDEAYITDENTPHVQDIAGNNGLAISKYLWCLSDDNTSYYFGSNFKNYIGHIDNKIVMVKPVNGQRYDTFIFGQYFGTVMEGSTAPTEATLKVIDMINALPKEITLESEGVIVAARKAYEDITSKDQQALVTNIEALESAETTLAYIKQREEGNKDPEPVAPETEGANGTVIALAVTCGVLGLMVLGAAAAAVVLFLKKKNGEKSE